MSAIEKGGATEPLHIHVVAFGRIFHAFDHDIPKRISRPAVRDKGKFVSVPEPSARDAGKSRPRKARRRWRMNIENSGEQAVSGESAQNGQTG